MSRRRRRLTKHPPKALSLSATDTDWAVVKEKAERRRLSISRYAVALVLGGGWDARDGPALVLDAREQREMFEAVRAFRALMGDGAQAPTLIADMQARVALLFDAWAIAMVRDGRRDALRALLAARVTSIAGVRSRNCCDVSANGCDVVALRCVAAAGGPGLWLHREPDWDSRSTCCARLRSSPAGLAQLTRGGCDAASSSVTAERGVSMSSTGPAVVSAPCGRTSFAPLNHASSASGISEVSMSSSVIAAISANRFCEIGMNLLSLLFGRFARADDPPCDLPDFFGPPIIGERLRLTRQWTG